jgi:peptidoglycan/LPS O-acetylase OafA/YrhL
MNSTIGAPVTRPRYFELDSLRGLAALAVVFTHIRSFWEMGNQPTSANFMIFLDLTRPFGFEAVVLFFVLSGFVLTLPAVEGKPQSYFVFVTRRIFRLYVPYLAALAISVAGAFWLDGPGINSPFGDCCWSEPVSWGLVGQHVMFLGVYDTSVFDLPVWSLVHEMRISLFFPFLCAFVLRFKNRWSFALALFLTAASVAIAKLHSVGSAILLGVDNPVSIPDTLYYAALFILGIYLARERASIAGWFSRLSRLAKISFGVGCVLLWGFAGTLLSSNAPRFFHWHFMPVAHWLTALGAGGLIVVCLNSRSCKRFLHWPPIHLLGQMSYSLYLMHFIVLMFCVHLLYGKIPLLTILFLALVLSLIVSWLSYRWVEAPSMNLGRRLSNALRSPSRNRHTV